MGTGRPPKLRQSSPDSPLTVDTDPRLFDDPMCFRPNRWLAHTGTTTLTGIRGLPADAYVPFGAGNRRCIGGAFATAEMKIVLAAVNQQWRLTPLPRFRPRTAVGGVARLDRLRLIVSARRP
ncbi:cytochrome P450 [Streptomyces sp. 3N207]|uniref:cytochrome P450 n=1 Tax=Streptomyces sp. 3N207 TaxID=3457417 RepID=UPI003FD31051